MRSSALGAVQFLDSMHATTHGNPTPPLPLIQNMGCPCMHMARLTQLRSRSSWGSLTTELGFCFFAGVPAKQQVVL